MNIFIHKGIEMCLIEFRRLIWKIWISNSSIDISRVNLKFNDSTPMKALSLLLTALNHKIPAECNKFKTHLSARNSSPKSVKHLLLTHCEVIACVGLPARHIPVEGTISSYPLWASPRNWGERLQDHHQYNQQLLWMILPYCLAS